GGVRQKNGRATSARKNRSGPGLYRGRPSLSGLDLGQVAFGIPAEDRELEVLKIALGIVIDLADGGVKAVGVHVIGDLDGIVTDGIDAVSQHLNRSIGRHGKGAIRAALVFLELFKNLLVALALGEVGRQ